MDNYFNQDFNSPNRGGNARPRQRTSPYGGPRFHPFSPDSMNHHRPYRPYSTPRYSPRYDAASDCSPGPYLSPGFSGDFRRPRPYRGGWRPRRGSSFDRNSSSSMSPESSPQSNDSFNTSWRGRATPRGHVNIFSSLKSHFLVIF